MQTKNPKRKLQGVIRVGSGTLVRLSRPATSKKAKRKPQYLRDDMYHDMTPEQFMAARDFEMKYGHAE